MASVNKVILVGNLGRDPETRRTASGDQVCNLAIATTEVWKDRNTGERRENTEWHRVVFFGRVAEVAAQYLRKGSQVYVEGRLQTRKWQDQNGQDRYTTEIRGDEMKMLGSRQSGSDTSFSAPDDTSAPAGQFPSSAQQNPPPKSSGAPGAGFADFDDDIPF